MTASSVYDPNQTEVKWQKAWEKSSLFQDSLNHPLPGDPLFLLFAFAYPSGAGLHVGHVESKTALDILARYYRMQGRSVYFPVGWDAFGLPAENYAIKTGVPPATTTKQAIDTFRQQIKRIGISYDWQSEIATSHEEYYRWTQWLFLQLFAAGLAYKAPGTVNWCPSCQTVLANEQVVEGLCERCGTAVIQKQLEQWYFKITDYKDELISGLDQVDWPPATKQQQLNWIGKAKGLSIDFTLKKTGQALTVWTKFWETIFGTTFLVMAPEKFTELGLEAQLSANKKAAVTAYLKAAQHKTEEERRVGEKDKTGVDTGLLVINPVNGREVPLFIADYVLSGVGTAIVMGVPAHDARDFAFAQKYQLPIIQVISFADPKLEELVSSHQASVEGDGNMVNSGQFDGLAAWQVAKPQMADWMIQQKFARWQTTYKLRDWLISRQRYWGAPIPIVYDPQGKPHPVKTEHLPWLLPTDVDFKPTGESPLKSSKEFVARTEKLYGKGWRPEYDTMDTFVDSSWYYLRFTDPRQTDQFARPARLNQWLPVDFYMIGPEHIVLHLLYSRFFTKFLRDQGLLQFDEPFMKMRHQGMILGPDGRKMSKSKGNVINPDEIIEKFGADTLRVYEMFMGPIDADKPWDVRAVIGVYRFLHRLHQRVTEFAQLKPGGAQLVPDQELRAEWQRCLAKITKDLPELKFNTAVAALMEFLNAWEAGALGGLLATDVQALVLAVAPLAPFLAEELYHKLVEAGLAQWPQDAVSVHQLIWPPVDESLLANRSVVMAVQVNGKLRGELLVSAADLNNESTLMSQAEQLEGVARALSGRVIRRRVFIPGKVINLVVE